MAEGTRTGSPLRAAERGPARTSWCRLGFRRDERETRELRCRGSGRPFSIEALNQLLRDLPKLFVELTQVALKLVSLQSLIHSSGHKSGQTSGSTMLLDPDREPRVDPHRPLSHR